MGRARQPYCPDCLKNGVEVLKPPGLGYCKSHMSLRQKAYKNLPADHPDAELTPEQRRAQEEYKELLSLRAEVELLREQNATLRRQLMEREAHIGKLASRNADLLMQGMQFED